MFPMDNELSICQFRMFFVSYFLIDNLLNTNLRFLYSCDAASLVGGTQGLRMTRGEADLFLWSCLWFAIDDVEASGPFDMTIL